MNTYNTLPNEYKQHLDLEEVLNVITAQDETQVVEKPRKVGRNEPCPCGSGKKYKKCCGKGM